MNIAIVNDMPLATEALRRAIALLPGCKVVWTARNGAEAVDACARQTPDLILMDVVMPNLNGFQATRTIAKDPKTSHIPIILVTMRGNKSGDIRKIALMRVEHDGEYALIASMGGAPKNPVWYSNLTADPDHVLIQDGPEPFAVTVRELEGDERQTWWDRGVAVFPNYAEYQAKTERRIPILLATRT